MTSQRIANVAKSGTDRSSKPLPGRPKMKYFSVGQNWVGRYGIFGTFFGEVIEVPDEGECGVVIITDYFGNEMDTYTGSAADFQSSGEWQVADHDLALRWAETDPFGSIAFSQRNLEHDERSDRLP